MFCPNCGTEFLPGAKFCAACGGPAPVMDAKAPNPPPASDPASATEEPVKEVPGEKTFTLTIKYRWIDLLPANTPIEVIIDDTENYKVEEGKSIQIPLSPGEHKVTFYALLRKKTVSVVISKDRTLVVRWTYPLIGIPGFKVTEEAP